MLASVGISTLAVPSAFNSKWKTSPLGGLEGGGPFDITIVGLLGVHPTATPLLSLTNPVDTGGAEDGLDSLHPVMDGRFSVGGLGLRHPKPLSFIPMTDVERVENFRTVICCI